MNSLAIVRALARFYVRSVPADWYRRFPYLPVPPGPYVRWRMETAYGHRSPRLGESLSDLWQFGEWLAYSERERTRRAQGDPWSPSR